jgi:hypothetical protein
MRSRHDTTSQQCHLLQAEMLAHSLPVYHFIVCPYLLWIGAAVRLTSPTRVVEDQGACSPEEADSLTAGCQGGQRM